MNDRALAKKYLCSVYGDKATFREGQLEAILTVLNGKRALVVQKTGWGKSLIYFLSTKILRNNEKGLTIVISPLLSLMNNQIALAEKFNLTARTINTNNIDEWDNIEKEILDNKVDVLFISPERLANEKFNINVLPSINKSIGMLVIDEAHCISDWGHDFRPDYRRIINIIKFLPPNVPLLATTATANDRVIDDIHNQLGNNVSIQRGALVRESIAIQMIYLNRKEERLAWISENVPNIQGTGIIYCLTKNDCNLVSKWLIKNGIDSHAYYSGIEAEERLKLEEMFINNELKVLVATNAFGMGIDKPDTSFVIHFQKPGNVVSYYQQIGRAGRAIKKSYAILLAGNEDDDITNYFIETAFPTYKEMDSVVNTLDSFDSLSINEIMSKLDISKSRLEKCLKFLMINGDISKDRSKYYKTPRVWLPDMEYSDSITEIRKHELARMNDFIQSDECYMKFVANELNDDKAKKCKKCSNCMGSDIFDTVPNHETIIKAIEFIKKEHYVFEPRKKWPSGVKHENKNKIGEDFRCEQGLALSNYGDAGWGKIVRVNKYKDECFNDELVKASAKLLKEWVKKNNIVWITSIPSLRRPNLVSSFAEKLAKKLQLPYQDSIIKIYDLKQQKELNNSHKQYENAWNSFEVEDVQEGNVLLVDDMVDSKWTFTVCAYKLIEKGSGKVYPYALSNTAGSGKGD